MTKIDRNNLPQENVKIPGLRGTWYTISEQRTFDGHTLRLMEHETYGEDADHVIIDEESTIILRGVSNGWDDYNYALESFYERPLKGNWEYVRIVFDKE